MPAFRLIRDIDVVRTVLTPSKQMDVCSGTLGWRGGDGSGSISLYAGARGVGGSGVVRTASGSAYPLTASISYVELKLSDSLAETSVRWNNRHWSLIEGLYGYHSRYNTSYSTASYDYQCIFFREQWPNIISFSGSRETFKNVSGSMCVEAWVMPFTTESQHHNGHTISSCNALYWIGLTGSNAKLAFTSSLGLHTSSMGLTPFRWNHVAISVGNGTGSLYVNLSPGKVFNYVQTQIMQVQTTSIDPVITIGNQWAGTYISLTGGRSGESAEQGSGTLTRSFFGLIHEYRHWSSSREWTQISSSYNKRIPLSGPIPLLYMPMTEGHRSGSYDGGVTPLRPVVGSGALNPSQMPDGVYGNFWLRSFYLSPTWLPNTNPDFFVQPTSMRESSYYTRDTMRVLNIPKLFYGRQIATGSFTLTCRSFSGVGSVRTLRDDGRGAIYAESYASSSLDDEIDAAKWNRVGNIFYSEGVVVLYDDGLLDFGADMTGSTANAPEMLSVSFRGVSHQPVNMISCRLAGDEATLSLNDTFHSSSQDDRREAVSEDTYITSVVLYDSKRRPVAVGKLAVPMRKRSGDRLNLRLRQDF